MPWMPELFSAPALERFREERRQGLASVPYFDGVIAGELDALVESFAGEPELHHPVRGRIRGAAAFAAFVTETNEWLTRRNVVVEDVERVIEERSGFEEVILHLDGEARRVDLPVAIVAEKQPGGRLDELRMYFASRSHRPPLLQRDPDLRVPDAMAGHLRAFYDGGMPLELCAVIDHERACAVEYNVVRRAGTEPAPQAGAAVFVRDRSGELAAARIYDHAGPPASGV